MLAKYDWIATDKQYFGQANTAYDFGANDPKEVSRRLAKLHEQKVGVVLVKSVPECDVRIVMYRTNWERVSTCVQ